MPVPPSFWWPDLTEVPWPPPQSPPSSDHLTNSVYTFVPLDNIAPTPVQSSMEEVPCASFLAEMPCASAHSSEVHCIPSPPTKPTNDHPGSRVVTKVWEDPGYLAEVDNPVIDQELFVTAVLTWDMSILSHLHTTEALDEALFKWDCICMGSCDPKWSPIPFRNNVPPGDIVVCGIWAQVASSPSASSSPSALVQEPVPNDYGPSGLITCLSDQISRTDLLDFSTSPHVHAQCFRASLPSHPVLDSGCDSTLAAVAAAFHLDTVAHVRSDFGIMGLSDGDALVCCLAMTTNLLSNTGTNICLGNDKSLFIDIHNIDPIPVSLATTPKDAMQITYCHRIGYLPMPCEDESIHMQPWYIHPDAVGCMLSPESIMSTSLDITSWYQEDFRDNSSPGILCFRNSYSIPVLNLSLQKHNDLYYGYSNALSIDHNPTRVHCVDGALVLRASAWTGSHDDTPHTPVTPPAKSPTLIEANDSLCGSLKSNMSDVLMAVNNVMDSPEQTNQPSCSLKISPSGQSTYCVGSTTGTCQHKRRPADPVEILLPEFWAAQLGHCEEWQLEILPAHANVLPPRFKVHPMRFVDHKIQALLRKQPANKPAIKSWHPGQ